MNKIYITATRKLEKYEIDAIKKSFDTDAEVEQEIDESIVGGVIIRYEDKLFDGSIRTQLENLRQELKK